VSGRPLRIAAHNGSLIYGGGEKWTVLLLRGLRERGHAVHLFCNSGEVGERARREGVPASLGLLGGQLMLPHAVRLSRQVRRFAPDALVLTTFKKVWLGAMAGRLARVPVVVSRIGLDTDLPRRHWTYRLALRRWVHRVLVNADGIRRDFVGDLPAAYGDRVRTVYDGVELGPDRGGDTAAARAALGLPEGVSVVGSVTRLSDQKRLDRLLAAASLLPQAHVALAGEGPLESDLRAQAERLGISHRVHFLGYRGDVAQVLRSFDVFALTSDKEGMANAMLEAMAAGVPVVSTLVSGAEEALAPDDEGRAPGVIVEPDPEGIARALRGLLDDPAKREAMGREGLKRARERFSYESMLDAWEAALRPPRVG
jgi:glycosyltransferase involved in cell wall biosynthesis